METLLVVDGGSRFHVKNSRSATEVRVYHGKSVLWVKTNRTRSVEVMNYLDTKETTP